MTPNTEDTVFNGMSNESAKTLQSVAASKGKKMEVKPWQKVVIGGTSGIIIGVGGAIAANVHTSVSADSDVTSVTDNGAEAGLRTVAVDDSMTFKEAFDAARAEVGPGGAFEWHGNVYGTYTADEWAGMSEEEQSSFVQQVNSETSAEEVANNHETEVVDVNAVDDVADADDADDVQIVGAADDYSDDDSVIAVSDSFEDHDVYLVDVDDEDVDDVAVGVDDTEFVAEVDAYDAQDSGLTADLGVADADQVIL